MSQLTADEIERGLKAVGVPPDRARAEALRQTGKGPGFVPGLRARFAEPVTAPPIDLPSIRWPLHLTLPWSHLVSDNCRFAAGTERRGGGLLLTADYRRCRGLIRDRVRDLLGHPAPAPVAIPLRLVSQVWVPDETRAHDVCNFAKAVHDSLQGVVVTNDRWLWDTRWIHAGCDVDAPRCELTLTPLTETPTP